MIYLHDRRGVPLGIAGLAAATGSAFGLLSALAAGSLADRGSPRNTMIGGLVISTVGFALYPLVDESWQAIAVAALTGTGIGIWLTMQSALLAAIVPPDLRHLAFGQQRVAANVGLGLGGFVGGLIVFGGTPGAFTTLFLLNSVTFMVYAAVLLGLRVSGGPTDRQIRKTGSYRAVLDDRVFVCVLALNLLFVASTVSMLNSLFPVFAKNEGGVDEGTIGALFLLNSLVIITAQIPTTRAVEGHRRMRMLALMGVLFAVCWALVLAGGAAPTPTSAAIVFAAGICVMSLGECLYDSVQGPLAAGLAPDKLRGRYMAATGFSWQLGFIIGPGVGGVILAAEPYALWAVTGLVSLVGSALALTLDRLLPTQHRVTPKRPAPQAGPGIIERVKR